MLISMAYAQEMVAENIDVIADAPSATNAFAWNMGMIIILVVMFYILLIRPQQKRFQEHKAMLDGLKKGDKIVTNGGLVGKVDKLSGDDEVMIDLGNKIKVTAMRHSIQTKVEKDTPKAEKDTKKK
ncbi:MAG: preprotein translocase subunit YajC [Alphaproteobacteria bacterium]|nr:preprotein translocase subunit YajC [Alphaproteobacteria bacterium]